MAPLREGIALPEHDEQHQRHQEIDDGVGRRLGDLQDVAHGADEGEQERHDDDAYRVAAGQPRDEKAGEAVTRRQGRNQPSLDRRDLGHAGQTRDPARQHHRDDHGARDGHAKPQAGLRRCPRSPASRDPNGCGSSPGRRAQGRQGRKASRDECACRQSSAAARPPRKPAIAGRRRCRRSATGRR